MRDTSAHIEKGDGRVILTVRSYTEVGKCDRHWCSEKEATTRHLESKKGRGKKLRHVGRGGENTVCSRQTPRISQPCTTEGKSEEPKIAGGAAIWGEKSF